MIHNPNKKENGNRKLMWVKYHAFFEIFNVRGRGSPFAYKMFYLYLV